MAGRRFGAAFFLLLATSGASDPVDNGNALALVAERLVLDGWPSYPGHVPGYSVVGPDGRAYGKFGLGQSLVLVPAVWGTRVLSLGLDDPRHVRLATTLLWHAIPAALGACLFVALVALGQALGLGMRAALLGAAAALLTTPAWEYTRVFYSEGLLAACTAGALVAAVRAVATGRASLAVLAGFAAGGAFLTKPPGGLVLVAVALYLLVPRTGRARRVALYALGAVGPTALTLAYNRLRTGSLWRFAYTEGIDRFGFTEPLWRGLAGLLLSPGKGLLWYAPLVVVGLLAWRRTGRRAERMLVLGLSGGFLLVTARWWCWHGGEGWGPRLLVPVIPLAVLPAGAWLDASGWRRRWAWGLAVLGFAVQLLGVTIHWQEFYRRVPYETWAQAMHRVGPEAPVEALGRHNLDSTLFTVRQSPMVGHAWLLEARLVGRDDLRPTCPWGGPVRSPQVDYDIDWWPLATGPPAVVWPLWGLMMAAGVLLLRSGRGSHGVAKPVE